LNTKEVEWAGPTRFHRFDYQGRNRPKKELEV
jgi:hypothetical protein